MTADVKIGSETIKMCGNAATAIRYKAIFHRDLLMTFKGMSNEENFDSNIIKELAFVMTQQAQGADFKQVSFDDYVAWLEQFEMFDVYEILPVILELWGLETKELSEPKKENEK